MTLQSKSAIFLATLFGGMLLLTGCGQKTDNTYKDEAPPVPADAQPAKTVKNKKGQMAPSRVGGAGTAPSTAAPMADMGR